MTSAAEALLSVEKHLTLVPAEIRLVPQKLFTHGLLLFKKP